MTEGFFGFYMSEYVKNYRKIEQWKFYKKPAYAHLWQHLIRKAHYNETPIYDQFGNKIFAGQLSTNRKQLAKETGINPSTIDRILKALESEHQIEQQKTNKCRIISITNWHLYQEAGSKVNIKRTSSEHQLDTKQEMKDMYGRQEVSFKAGDQITPDQLIDLWNKNFPDRIRRGFGIGGGIHFNNFIKSVGHMPRLEQWQELFSRCRDSKLLMGKTDLKSNWFTFTWVIDYDNAQKVLEGKYDNAEQSRSDYSFLMEVEI